MDKVLLSLLVAGVSFLGIQEASAVKTLKVEDNTNVKRRSVNILKNQPLNMYETGYFPSTPSKKRSVMELKVIENPTNFYLGGDNILWQKKSKVWVLEELSHTPRGPLGKNLAESGKGVIKMSFQHEILTLLKSEEEQATSSLQKNFYFPKGELTSPENIPTIIVTLED